MRGLRFGVEPTIEKDEDEDMLIYHQYTWHEAIPADDERNNFNVRLKRLSVDILLPGATHLEQVRLAVSDDGTTLHFTYRPPSTYLSANRTATRLTGQTFGVAAIGVARETISAAARVQAHRTALEQVRVDQVEKVRHIPLKEKCDRHLTTRDDWGRENRADGVCIAMYRHDHPDFIANNQFVWILHVELTCAARPIANPTNPVSFQDWSNHA